MQREPQRFQQTAMTLWQKLGVCGSALLLFMSAVLLRAQDAVGSRENGCLAIHVHLNGKLIDDPQAITFKTKEEETTVSKEGGCFRVPSSLLAEKSVDVLFTVPKNRVYLSSIVPGFFAGPWDVELEDERFSKDIILPKHARVTEVCAVVFHVGEPETAITQAPCRTPF
jgi:hypothetical protein